MKFFFLIGSVVLFLSATSVGQVHIRDTVSISPATEETAATGTNNHVLTFDLTLEYPSNTAIVVVSGPNYYREFSGIGSVGGELDAPAAGQYYFTPCLAGYQQDYHTFDPSNCFVVYYDGKDIGGQQCGTFESEAYKNWDVLKDLKKSFSTPYYSNFNFTFTGINPDAQPDYFGRGERGDISVSGTYENNSSAWSSHTDPLILTITQGSQYASFHKFDYITGIETNLGSSISIVGDDIYRNTYRDYSYYIVADGIQPGSIADWIEVTAQSNGITKSAAIQILPPPVVTVSQYEFKPDETGEVTVKHRDLSGQLVDYPGNQLFELGAICDEGCGYFFAQDDYWDHVYNAKPPFIFKAGEIESGSETVVLRVGTVYSGHVIVGSTQPYGRGGLTASSGTATSFSRKYDIPVDSKTKKIFHTAEKPESNRKEVSIAPGDFYSTDFGDADVVIKNEHTILLGETIYYQAIVDESDPSKLNFAEMRETSGWIPGGQAATFTVTPEEPSDKLAAYYEYKDQEGTPLAGDMIRLVGRYWEDGKKFKVQLSAVSGDATGSIEIEVKKPARLGPSPVQANKDVFGNSQDIDALVIKYAGQYGIPPQYLKGQIEQESSFYPAYRYEPFVDVNGQDEFSQSKYDRFRVVSSADLGSVTIPVDHINVSPISYLGYQGTVWDYLYSHSQSINPSVSSENNIYPITNSRGTLLWFNEAAEGWQNIFSSVLEYGGSLGQAYAEANDWLETMYADGNMDKIAQTRMGSSYGLLQILYSTARWKQKYPLDDAHSPERLNESQNTAAYSVPYLLSQLESVLTDSGDTDNNWSRGFEETFRWAFSYYNTGGRKVKNSYGVSIVDVKSPKYLPSAGATNP